MRRFLALCTAVLFALPHAAMAWPTDIWGVGLVEAASPVKERIHDFNMLLQWMMLAIVIVVTVLVVYAVIRFRRARNPVPSKRTHNVPLEIVWTLIPCVILAVIMWFSFPLMYYADVTEKPDLTLKVTGYQWYWGYSYPDQEIEEYSTYMVPEERTDEKGEFTALRNTKTYQRLLSTYELGSGREGFIVVPVDKNVRVLVTANDVIHAFAVPALGVKKDAVPGRLNETWLRVTKPGIYYGQCSELCGTLHAYMPIEVRAVDQATFDQWAAMMKTDVAGAFAMIQDKTLPLANPQMNIAERLTWRDVVAHFGTYFGFKIGVKDNK